MKKNIGLIIQIGIVVILVGILMFNLGRRSSDGGITGNSITSFKEDSGIIPTGTPKIYGNELKVKYDDISTANPRLADASIGVLGNLDNKITLTGADLDRYIKIASQISCEYCCGVASIIVRSEDVAAMNQKIESAIKTGQITEEQAKEYRQSAGAPACGCAHSYAMRGLAKYLIKNHPKEFSDDEILGELGKWKVLFFPDIHKTKAAILKEQGIEINYINLASNKYRGIEKGSSAGEMVGGC